IKKLQDWDLWLRLCAKYGDFYRLTHCNYRMNHEHLDRVSASISYAHALDALINRNRVLYDDDDIYLIKRYLISQRKYPDLRKEWRYLSDRKRGKFVIKRILKNIM